MTLLGLNIALAVIALLLSLAPIGGETWNKREPKLFRRLTWRGWFSVILIGATLSVTIIREQKTKQTHETENKQLTESMHKFEEQIHLSDKVRMEAELLQQTYLKELIQSNAMQKELLTNIQQNTKRPNQHYTSRIAVIDKNIQKYKENLQTLLAASTDIKQKTENDKFNQLLKDARKLLEVEQYYQACKLYQQAVGILSDSKRKETSFSSIEEAKSYYDRDDFRTAAKKYAEAFQKVSIQ